MKPDLTKGYVLLVIAGLLFIIFMVLADAREVNERVDTYQNRVNGV